MKVNCGKFCRNCKMAERLGIKYLRIEGKVMFGGNGMIIVNDTITAEQSGGEILQRTCSRYEGTQTVEPFDKCINKHEFEARPELRG